MVVVEYLYSMRYNIINGGFMAYFTATLILIWAVLGALLQRQYKKNQLLKSVIRAQDDYIEFLGNKKTNRKVKSQQYLGF